MRTYNEFSALWRAPLFNRALYADVAARWRGIGLLFLLLLVTLSWLVTLGRSSLDFNRFLHDRAPVLLADFPEIKIEKGIASSDAPQPYILKDEDGSPLFVFDTTGAITSPADVGARVLMTQTELLQVQATGAVERNSLSELPDMVLSRENFLRWGRTLNIWMIPVGVPCCGGWSVIWRLGFALVLGALGLAFNAAFGGGLKFASLMRLAMVSMTGPVLLATLLNAVGVSTSCWGTVLLPLLTLAYFIYGVKVGAEATRDAQGPDLAEPGPWDQTSLTPADPFP